MRLKFEEQLSELNRSLITMGTQCETAIALSAKALTDADVRLARRALELAADIDRTEREIETLCLKRLLQQQPVARDLRSISAALKMITDMARIGAQAADIAEIVTVADRSTSLDAPHISDMARATIKMVTESIDAFVKKDLAIARAVVSYDDVVDHYFDVIKRRLVELFASPGTNGEYALDLLMIAKYFERIGDHAVNIAEWVIFSITGDRKGEST